jgi:hypothetical protein
MERNFKLIFNELLSIFMLANALFLMILRIYVDFNSKLSSLITQNIIKFDLLVFPDNYACNF